MSSQRRIPLSEANLAKELAARPPLPVGIVLMGHTYKLPNRRVWVGRSGGDVIFAFRRLDEDGNIALHLSLIHI